MRTNFATFEIISSEIGDIFLLFVNTYFKLI